MFLYSSSVVKVLEQAAKAVLVFLAAVLACFAVLYYFTCVYPLDNSKFDQSAWIQADISKTNIEQWNKDAECIKGGMVGDLTRRYLRVGVTSRDEAIALLENRNNRNLSEENNSLRYSLGMCTIFRMSPTWLYLYFDADNKLQRVSTTPPEKEDILKKFFVKKLAQLLG